MHKRIFILLICSGLSGCGSFQKDQSSMDKSDSGYTYIPLDPFPVQIVPGDSCQKAATSMVPTVKETPIEAKQCNSNTPVYKDLLSSLPDNAVRMMVENISSSGSVMYGAGKIGGKSERYRVTADYISSDTINMSLWISKKVSRQQTILNADNKSEKIITPTHVTLTENLQTPLIDRYTDILNKTYSGYIPGSEQYTVRKNAPSPEQADNFHHYNIPVYVGIGIRITSDIEITGSTANISGIGVIGLEAEANNLKGSLAVQTLGVNGKAISSALPMQSELNATTAQNALISTASIKTLLYSDDTQISPRIVGLYLPFPADRSLLNAVISQLSSDIKWERPCYWTK